MDRFQPTYLRWKKCDLFFYSYPSRDQVKPLAEQFRAFLEGLFPRVDSRQFSFQRQNPQPFVLPSGHTLAAPLSSAYPYKRLILVGHSTGALIIREAILQEILPQKQDVAGDLRRIVTTLSDDALNAAIRKCQELGFDPNKGKISLEETLINLSQARDILLDAIAAGKLIQLPLKLQYALLSHSEKASQALTALLNGTDAVVNLVDAAEKLTASIWQFNLHNLSDQVLGFHNKMNQLKSIETRIRQVSREAEDFASLHEQATGLLGQLSEIVGTASKQQTSLQSSVEAVDGTVKKVTEQDQRVSALASQIEQHASAVPDQCIYEVSAVGEIVWKWVSSEHLDEMGFSEESLAMIHRGFSISGAQSGFLVINNMKPLGPNRWYGAGDPRFHPDNIIIDSREGNFIAIIDKVTGRLVW